MSCLDHVVQASFLVGSSHFRKSGRLLYTIFESISSIELHVLSKVALSSVAILIMEKIIELSKLKLAHSFLFARSFADSLHLSGIVGWNTIMPFCMITGWSCLIWWLLLVLLKMLKQIQVLSSTSLWLRLKIKFDLHSRFPRFFPLYLLLEKDGALTSLRDFWYKIIFQKHIQPLL